MDVRWMQDGHKMDTRWTQGEFQTVYIGKSYLTWVPGGCEMDMRWTQDGCKVDAR